MWTWQQCLFFYFRFFLENWFVVLASLIFVENIIICQKRLMNEWMGFDVSFMCLDFFFLFQCVCHKSWIFFDVRRYFVSVWKWILYVLLYDEGESCFLWYGEWSFCRILWWILRCWCVCDWRGFWIIEDNLC